MPLHHVPGPGGAPSIEDRLLASMREWQSPDPDGSSSYLIPALRAIESHRLVVEQAKGVLAQRFGIDSHQAFAILVRWSRTVHAPVHAIAHALIHGICEGHQQTERRQRPLMRWLEEQLRDTNQSRISQDERHSGWS